MAARRNRLAQRPALFQSLLSAVGAKFKNRINASGMSDATCHRHFPSTGRWNEEWR